MIRGPAIEKRAIRLSNDLATPFYRLFWGRHIHHGLWNDAETPAAAQSNLMEAVIREARLRGGERVLDIGCGIGASAVHLAKAWDCQVTGVTISRVQQQWATLGALRERRRTSNEFPGRRCRRPSISSRPRSTSFGWWNAPNTCSTSPDLCVVWPTGCVRADERSSALGKPATAR